MTEHLRAMLAKYYPLLDEATAGQVAECAALKIFQMPGLNHHTKRGSHTMEQFVPKEVETHRPTSAIVPPELSGIAHRRYALSNPARGINNLAPVSADLNQGGWEVALAAAIGKNAIGVYIIRDTATGRIYKVGKATRSTTLVGRLESYAKDFMAHGVVNGGVRITAQVYKLPGDEKTAELVLRQFIVNVDQWDLSPQSKAADGTYNHGSPQGTSGWTVSTIE